MSNDIDTKSIRLIDKLNKAEIKENSRMLKAFDENQSSNRYIVDSERSNVLHIGVNQDKAIQVYNDLKEKSDAYIKLKNNDKEDFDYIVIPKDHQNYLENKVQKTKDYTDYFYPHTQTLKNKLDIVDPKKLAEVEGYETSSNLQELRKNPIEGNFNTEHLMDIHKKMFGEVYEWAGEIRDVSMMKGSTEFPHKNIKERLDTTFQRLSDDNHLKGLREDEFVEKFTDYYKQVNDAHPVVEGNGRSAQVFFYELAKQADYTLDFTKTNREEWNSAFANIENHGTKELENVLGNMIEPAVLTKARGRVSSELPITLKEAETANESPVDKILKEIKDNGLTSDNRDRVLEAITDKLLEEGLGSKEFNQKMNQIQEAFKNKEPSKEASNESAKDSDNKNNYEP